MRTLGLAALLALAACETAPAGAGGGDDVRRSPVDTGARDVPTDDDVPRDTARDTPEPNDLGQPETADTPAPETGGADVIVDDGFVRPDIPVATDTVDEPDAPAPDVIEDTDRRDVVIEDAISVAGRGDCLEWSVTSPYDVFDFKGIVFTVLYVVRNTCAETFLFHVDHFNDFFPIAIHKDGEFWTYLGNCPGEGPEHEWEFRTRGEGVTRGFTWQAENHEQLLTNCGVTFDPDATYELVGYGSSPISTFEPRSERYALTPPIPIEIRE